MRLNLPDIENLAKCKNVLVAGMGGGFDVFCGLPIYFELKVCGVHVHLANLSFTQLRWANDKFASIRLWATHWSAFPRRRQACCFRYKTSV